MSSTAVLAYVHATVTHIACSHILSGETYLAVFCWLGYIVHIAFINKAIEVVGFILRNATYHGTLKKP